MKYWLFIGVILTMGCAPSKTGEPVTVTIQCDSCYAEVENMASYGEQPNINYISTTEFKGNVTGLITLNFNRYSSNSCVRLVDYYSYTTDSVEISIIQNDDTLRYEKLHHRVTSWCY